MSIINFSNTRQMEGLFDAINPIKELIESKINLSRTADREKREYRIARDTEELHPHV